MIGRSYGSHIAPEKLRLMLLAFGVSKAYRIFTLDEIVHSIGQINREDAHEALERLSEECLVTRFAGRYCFNKAIPTELQRILERTVTQSGTLRTDMLTTSRAG
jgi:hypothetical protein